MIRSFVFFVLIGSFCLFGCSSEDGPNFYIDSCIDLVLFQDYLDSLEQEQDYIVSYVEEPTHHAFSFKRSESIAIPLDCISEVLINKDKLQILINYRDFKVQELSFAGNVNYSYVHDPNGMTPLSGVLNLTSDVDGAVRISVVEKSDNDVLFSHTFDSIKTQHIVPVLGMYYEHDNEIIVEYLVNETVFFRDTFYHKTGKQPDWIPEVNITKINLDRMEAGMHFIPFRDKENPTEPFMMDNNGNVRYHLALGNNAEFENLNYDVGINRLHNGNFYFGSINRPVIYELSILGKIENTWPLDGYTFHHEVKEKQDGNFLITVNKTGDRHENDKIALEDHVIEIDRISGEVITEWDLKTSLDENRHVMGVAEYSGSIDWAHINALVDDPRDNTIIVSLRYQGLVKLDYENNVKWILGNHAQWGENRKNEDLNTFLLSPLDNMGAKISELDMLNGIENHPDFEWPWYQHAVMIRDNGNIMLFDNGDNRNYTGIDKYSRVVEYVINETNNTVSQEWQYGKERGESCFSSIVSDVDYLEETNNVLMVPGSRVDNTIGFGAKILEIDYQSKEVYFEAEFPGDFIVFHRAERMRLYP